MTDELVINKVSAQSTGIHGRCIASARTNHFVIDEPVSNGGPGEAVTPAESFLGGVVGCAVLLIETFARQSNYPLKRATGSIEGIRTKADLANFQEVRLRIELRGVNSEQADDLVERFKGR